MKHFNLTLKLSKVRAYSLCAEKAWEGYELYIQEDKQVTSQIICMCVSVCQLLLSPGAGPAGACSYHLKFQSNSHSVAVPGCDNTQTSQLLLCLCAGSSSALQSDGPFFSSSI